MATRFMNRFSSQSRRLRISAQFASKLYFLTAVSYLLACSGVCWASDRSPFRATAHILTPKNLVSVRYNPGEGAARDFDPIPEVSIRTRVRGVGFVSFSLTTRKNALWEAVATRNGRLVRDSAKPVLLQGYAKSGSRRKPKLIPLAASIIGDELKASFAHSRSATRARLYTVSMKLDGSFSVSAQMTSVPNVALTGMACASGHAFIGETFGQNQLESAPLTTGPLKVVTISTDADAEWYAKYGEASNAQIAAIINAADVVYRNQLGITFRLIKQHVYTGQSSLVSTNPGTLLSQFTGNPENSINLAPVAATFNTDVDIKHLFSGKELDGSVVGIAYIGVVCTAADSALGITQDYSNVTWGIFAHEVGHNFGASHDSTDPSSVMYPSISMPPSTTFSTISRAEINKHFEWGGAACLDSVIGEIPVAATPIPPTPTPPFIPEPEIPLPPPLPTIIPTLAVDPSNVAMTLNKLRLETPKRSFYRLSGRLKRIDGQPYEGIVVQLVTSGNVVARARTRADGSYYFFVEVRIPLSERMTAWVETQDGVAASNTVRLKRLLVRQLKRR